MMPVNISLVYEKQWSLTTVFRPGVFEQRAEAQVVGVALYFHLGHLDGVGHAAEGGDGVGAHDPVSYTHLLLDAGEREPQQTLPVLLDRLNTVLPAVKEAHMYATFTGLRLGADGRVFYALAASPPLLQWHAEGQGLSNMEQAQFPLGLLPVPRFEAVSYTHLERSSGAPGSGTVGSTIADASAMPITPVRRSSGPWRRWAGRAR